MATVPDHWHRRVRVFGRARRVVAPAAFSIVVLATWELGTVVTGVPTVILPAPTDVAVVFLANAGMILEASVVTALTAAGGLATGLLVGFPVAYLVSRSRGLAAFLLPYVVALRVAPVVAIAPLVVLWVGEGIPARVLLVTTLTVFPVVIASYDGLRAVPGRYVDLARSVNAPSYAVFFRVKLPAAAPSVFAGVKLGAALSVVGAVVAEFVTLESGIGFQVFEASTYLETELMFASLAALAAVGLVFYGVPALVERRSRWG